MRWGISGGTVPVTKSTPYAETINTVCIKKNFPPMFAYAIAWHESIQGEVNGKWVASKVVSNDNGHGLFQLTTSWPSGTWMDAKSNTEYALDNYLIPDALYWYRMYGYTDDALVRCVAASFNAGLGGALRGHGEGDVDKYTTDHYAAAVEAIYDNLVARNSPV